MTNTSPVVDDDDIGEFQSAAEVASLLLESTRALLWVETPPDARHAARDLVIGLGGRVVPATEFCAEAVPIDLSFGAGEPELPAAPLGSQARREILAHLATFVEDARRAIERNRHTEQLAEDASIDLVTGLRNRRMLGRSLGRIGAGDVVIMIDLDHFKHINDTYGHHEGDRVLAAFGETLRETVRGRDEVGRFGGEEFMLILVGDPDPGLFLSRLRDLWTHRRPYPISFSAGVSRFTGDAASTVAAADAAMYRAKALGRDQWCYAEGEGASAATDDGSTVPTSLGVSSLNTPRTFIAVASIDLGSAVLGDLTNGLRPLVSQRLITASEGLAGLRCLEVWVDIDDPTKADVVSWWASLEAFQAAVDADDGFFPGEVTLSSPSSLGHWRHRQMLRFEVVAK